MLCGEAEPPEGYPSQTLGRGTPPGSKHSSTLKPLFALCRNTCFFLGMSVPEVARTVILYITPLCLQVSKFVTSSQISHPRH